MCLPYFLRKTRPTTSYDLLEAFSSSLAADRASVGLLPTQIRTHPGAWKPESRSIYHTRAANPNSGWVSPGRRFAHIRQRQSQSSLPHPAPAHPHPAPPTYRPTRPHPRAHTHAPTPTRRHPRADTHAPTPTRRHQTKKNLKKKLTSLVFAPIVQA